ncbi:Arylsulfatase I [Portunus trituberculatus]|uniref:Arylsulfatase I n=1 Tax=Portunus trituberculatus TaxID=210409 RepID=A0A5B7IRC7_PORTR|nr:Arylsulfatase I [Portunus trituberculatus]
MEALAREGVILEQSYVQPICTPTRSALLTGRYPFTIGRQVRHPRRSFKMSAKFAPTCFYIM